jgi:hypothetical protein
VSSLHRSSDVQVCRVFIPLIHIFNHFSHASGASSSVDESTSMREMQQWLRSVLHIVSSEPGADVCVCVCLCWCVDRRVVAQI